MLGYEYRKMAIIELLSYLPKTALFFLGARMGYFQHYGIMMFGAGQLVFTSIWLLLTWAQAPNKTLFLQ